MALALLCVNVAFLLYIGWRDFLTLKIRNPHVLILSGLALAYGLAAGLETFPMALLAGAVLFVMAFVFWLFGLVGAGDAKLYFPVGVLLGIDGLVPYLVGLLALSILMVFAFRLGNRVLDGRGVIGARLAELRETRAIPYSVPMSLATVGALLYTGQFAL